MHIIIVPRTAVAAASTPPAAVPRRPHRRGRRQHHLHKRVVPSERRCVQNSVTGAVLREEVNEKR